MISYLKGMIVEKNPTRLLLDVNGIGYDINITLNCSRQIGTIGNTITILTYLHIKDDNIQLYGFISKQEREVFLHLISTPGIGPKKALAILSGSTAEDLQRYIIEENLAALTSLSGVGKKTAQRLIIDLKEKITSISSVEQILPTSSIQQESKLIQEAIMALLSLGYKNNVARKAIQSVLSNGSEKITLEELIREALKKI